MEGKFRKRASTVWCPKSKIKFLWKQFTPEQNKEWKRLAAINYGNSEEYKELKKTLPQRKTKSSGWVNMVNCESCEFLEEFHLDNNGVFCLWKSSKSDGRKEEKQ